MMVQFQSGIHTMAVRLCNPFQPTLSKQAAEANSFELTHSPASTAIKGRISCFEEHEKRAWSVDFSPSKPTMLASGSDDSKVH